MSLLKYEIKLKQAPANEALFMHINVVYLINKHFLNKKIDPIYT